MSNYVKLTNNLEIIYKYCTLDINWKSCIIAGQKGGNNIDEWY
jgi:hypothetical protein